MTILFLTNTDFNKLKVIILKNWVLVDEENIVTDVARVIYWLIDLRDKYKAQ